MEGHNRTKSFFASDFHLGVDSEIPTREREEMVVAWLDFIENEARSIFLVGDIFDYWFEYKYVIPKGFHLLFGKLATLVRDGVEIHFFKGNHDMWLRDYFQKEVGLIVHDESLNIYIDEKKFNIQHGDGLIKGNFGYRFVRRTMRNKTAQFLFSCLHPSFGIPLMKYFSRKSRENDLAINSEKVLSEMIQGANKNEEFLSADFLICGHCHKPTDIFLDNDTTRFINLGDWTREYTYGEWDGNSFSIKKYNPEL